MLWGSNENVDGALKAEQPVLRFDGVERERPPIIRQKRNKRTISLPQKGMQAFKELRTTKSRTIGEMHCLDDFILPPDISDHQKVTELSISNQQLYDSSNVIPPVRIIWIGFRLMIKSFTIPVREVNVITLSQMIRMQHLVEVSCSHTTVSVGRQ